MYKKIFLPLLCLMTIGIAAAQQKTPITGNVSDATSGEPLLGVSIRVDGTSIGTSSDIDGNYSISAPGNATLIFTYMGYEPARVEVKDRSVVNVKMNVKAELMEEVVVVGYTSMKNVMYWAPYRNSRATPSQRSPSRRQHKPCKAVSPAFLCLMLQVLLVQAFRYVCVV